MDYDENSFRGKLFQDGKVLRKPEGESSMILQRELISSQMLNTAQENTIRKLKLQLKMKEEERRAQHERQVCFDMHA